MLQHHLARRGNVYIVAGIEKCNSQCTGLLSALLSNEGLREERQDAG
jgi:hypothetical protein